MPLPTSGQRRALVLGAVLVSSAAAESTATDPSAAMKTFKTALTANYGDAMMRPGIAKAVAGAKSLVDEVKVQLTVSRYAALDQPLQAFSFDEFLERRWNCDIK